MTSTQPVSRVRRPVDSKAAKTVKLLIKGMISRAVQNEFFWRLLDSTILRASRYAAQKRAKYERPSQPLSSIVSDAIQAVCPDLVIRHGVFKGMKYPQMKSIGSALFPKLLGTYERELQPVVERICGENYTEIVNVGCGEGYYAIGLALRIPKAKVYAYDIDDEAIRLCEEMARLNKVDQRVFTGSFCDTATLNTISLTKGLIFCDCEGFEKQLFTKDSADALSNCDLIIEVHDFIDITISSYIHDLFADSHEIEIIESLDDIKKAKTYNYKEIERYDLATRRTLLAELRPSIMEWFYLKARN